MYFEEEKSRSFLTIYGYTKCRILFNTQVLYMNSNGKPYAFYEKIDNEPGFYRRINSEGAYSEKWFETFSECIQYPGEALI